MFFKVNIRVLIAYNSGSRKVREHPAKEIDNMKKNGI